MISLTDKSVCSPILEVLHVNCGRYSKALQMKLAEFTSVVNCRDTCGEFETATGIHVPKSTVHGFIHEIGPLLPEADKTAEEPETVMGYSTEVGAFSNGEIDNVHVTPVQLADRFSIWEMTVNTCNCTAPIDRIIHILGGSNSCPHNQY